MIRMRYQRKASRNMHEPLAYARRATRQQAIPSTPQPQTTAAPAPDVPTEHPNPDARLFGFLGRALSLVFSAGQHYLAQAAQAKFRQEIPYAEAFIGFANEKFQQANLITDRMVALGAVPAGSVLSPATPSNTLAEALHACEVRGMALTQLYAEASQYSLHKALQADAVFFKSLQEAEQRQLIRIQEWLQAYYYQLGLHSNQPANTHYTLANGMATQEHSQ
ncbi:MAG: ferritin-like domain-containing protein [bacterium]